MDVQWKSKKKGGGVIHYLFIPRKLHKKNKPLFEIQNGKYLHLFSTEKYSGHLAHLHNFNVIIRGT